MADAKTVASGTAAGLLEFVDWLVDKGYATRQAVNPWKSAARQVFRTVEGEEYENVDISEIDPDEYMDRFDKLAGAQYKVESLASYRSRFRKAIDAYSGYLSDKSLPSFRASPTPKRSPRSKPKVERSAAANRSAASARPTASDRAMEMPGVGLIEYPFPLESGEVARLRLPARLGRQDAERLAAFVRTLVFEVGEKLPTHDSNDPDDGQG